MSGAETQESPNEVTTDPIANAWPAAPPVDGLVYEFTCPMTQARMAAMSMATYQRLKSDIQKISREMLRLKAENIDLLQKLAKKQDERRIVVPAYIDDRLNPSQR